MIGKKVRDRVTGFEGIVTGQASYISGCDQVCVQPKVGEDGKYVEGRWMDVTRVEVLDETPVFENATPDSGGPEVLPPAR